MYIGNRIMYIFYLLFAQKIEHMQKAYRITIETQT